MSPQHPAPSTRHVREPPRILLLSTTTGYQLRSFDAAARALGIELVLATDRCHALDDPWRDAAIPVRFHEEDASLDAVLAAARARPLHGVIALGDRPVPLAARVAAALGLPGHPADAARASAHKGLARTRFEAAGLPVPAWEAIDVGADLAGRTSALGWPVVIKPVSLSGSRGVIRANDGAELQAAFERIRALLGRPEIRALRTGSERELLIERFIDGPEYAVEGLLTAGTFRPLAIFDKPDPLDGPFFEETIYVTPSRAPALVQDAIVAAVARASTALGLWHGPVHAECRVTPADVYVIEVAARPIGGLCSRVLRFGSEESSLEALLLRHAAGEDVQGTRREAEAAAVMMVPIPRRGIYKGVTGEPAARRVPYVEDVVITAKTDQLLEPLPEAGSYLGFIFARAPRPAEAEGAVRAAHAHLAFAIEPAIAVRPAAEIE